MQLSVWRGIVHVWCGCRHVAVRYMSYAVVNVCGIWYMSGIVASVSYGRAFHIRYAAPPYSTVSEIRHVLLLFGTCHAKLSKKFNGLFSAWRRNDWNFVLYCSAEEWSEKIRASESTISGVSVTSLLLIWRWGILVPVGLPDILRIIDQTFFIGVLLLILDT